MIKQYELLCFIGDKHKGETSMEGSIRKLKEDWNYKIEIDEIYVQDALKNIDMMHRKDDGFIAVGQKMDRSWSQYHYKVDELKENIAKFLSLDGNLYMSPNSFFIPKRKIENIRHLNALYVDIDYYSIKELKGLDHEYIIGRIENNYYKDNLIPQPSFIMFTGKGLAVYWLIEPAPSFVLPLWNAIQRHFLSVLSDLGSDAKSIDSARVMRLAGSKHSKTQERAKLYIYDSELTYKLSDIQEDYLPALTPYVKNPGYRARGRKAKVVNYYTLYSLHYARLNDLVTLVELRNGYCRSEDGELIETGQREVMCFLYRYWYCCYCSDKDQALENTFEFNAKFVKPLSKREVRKITKSAEKAYDEWLNDSPNGSYARGGYNYTNAKLIKIFHTTQDEMKHMKTIINESEKKRRKNDKERAQRRNEDGLTPKQLEKKLRLEEVKALHESGLNQVQIADKLGLTRRTIVNDIKKLKEMGEIV